MKPHQIEGWALSIVDRVLTNQPVEDDRVELKREWPTDFPKTARQIAGHANASQGDSILWLIGVDERGKNVTGTSAEEVSTWLSQLQKQFDGLAPGLEHINVPVGEKTIVALLFSTDRAPFVVSNPAFNTQGGGSVQLEVPWREGTSTRSARRSDLLRILVPKMYLPYLELLGCGLQVYAKQHPSSTERIQWDLLCDIYVTPSPEQNSLVFPFHRCQARVSVPEILQVTVFRNLRITPLNRLGSYFGSEKDTPPSFAAKATNNEIAFTHPGRCHVKAHLDSTDKPKLEDRSQATVSLTLQPTGSDLSVSANYVLQRKGKISKNLIAEWEFVSDTAKDIFPWNQDDSEIS